MSTSTPTDATLLAIGVDSSNVAKGTADLAGLEAQARKTETSVDSLGAAQTAAKSSANSWAMQQVQAADATIALSDKTQRLLAQYDPLGAKLRSLQADFANLNAEVRAGAGAGSEDAIDKTYARLNEEIAKTKGLMQQAGLAEGFNAAAAGAERTALGTAGATRELIVLGHEAISGNFSRMPGSFLVLAERIHISADAIATLATRVLPVVAVFAILFEAFRKGAEEQEAMNQALFKSGDIAGTTRGQMLELSRAMADTGAVTLGVAKDIVTTLVASGQVGAESLKAIADVAGEYARATGEDAAKIGPELVKMFEDPAKGADKLNDSMHFLSIADLERIKELERQGELGEAQLLLADKLKDRLDAQATNVGMLTKVWNGLKGAAGSAWDAMLNIGRDSTLQDQLQKAQDAVDMFQKSAERQPNNPQVAAQLAFAQQTLAAMQAQVKAQNDVAAATGKAAEQNQVLMTLNKGMEQSATYRVRALNDEIALYKSQHDAIIANGGLEVDYQSRILQLEQQRDSITKKAAGPAAPDSRAAELALELAQEKAGFDEEKTLYDQRVAMLDTYHSKLHMSDTDFNAASAVARAQYTAAEQKSYDDQIKALTDYGSKSGKEYDEIQKKLVDVEAAHAKFLASMGKATSGDDLAGIIAEQKNYDGLLASINKVGDADIKRLNAAIAAQQKHNETIGMTKEQVDLLHQAQTDADTAHLEAEATAIEALLTEQGLDEKAVTIYQTILANLKEQIDARHQLAQLQGNGAALQAEADQAHAAAVEWKRTYDQINHGLTDAFVDAFDAGKNAGEALRDDLKRMFDQLVLRPIIQAVMSPISSGITSMLGGTAPAGAGGISGIGGDISSLMSGGSSLSGMGGLAGLGTSFATSGVGTSLGLSALGDGGAIMGAGDLGAGMTGAITGGAAGLTGMGATFAAAIPVIGWAVAAAAAIYSIVQANKKPSPVSGQFGITAGSGGFEDNASTASKFGNIGFLDQGTQQFSGEVGNQFSGIVSGLLDQFAQRETSDQIAQTTTALQGTNFPGFSGDYTTEDFIKQYGSQILKQVTEAAFDVLDPALSKVVEGFKGTDDELTTFIANLLLFHDAASKIPTDISDKLTASLNGTEAALDNALAFASAYKTLQDVMNADPLDDALKAIAASSPTVYSAYTDQATALGKLIDSYDGSASATTALASATVSYYNAQVQLLAQIEQVKEATHAMFGDTIRSMTLQTLNAQQKYNYLQDEADKLYAQLMATSDPAQVQALANKINDDLNAAFGMLSPEEQQSMLATYTDHVNKLDQGVTDHLNDIGTTTTNAAADLLTQIKGLFTDAVNKIAAAADMDSATAAQNAATADRNAATANTPIKLDVTVTGDTSAVGG